MPFGLLGYMVRAWDYYLSNNPGNKRLPMIVPLVVHHSETGWTAPAAFEELMNMDLDMLEVLRDHVVRFSLRLDDISFATDAELQGRATSTLSKVILWCLRDSRKPAWFREERGGWRALLLEATRGRKRNAAALRIVNYVFATNDGEFTNEVAECLITAVGELRRKDVMTIAESLRREGFKEGERSLLLKQLTVRFGALSEAVVALVNAADAALIELWGERILTAATLDDVLRQP
jgi:hypothetical protein